ncbi:hypothetical protein GCM10007908_03250 [Rhizobium albus]|nr:hypothetical protein GCM10007908_03250 [Rhizobium albus]
MGMISNKLRNSARGNQCTFQIPGVCNSEPETTVLCHLPSDAKGMGNKSDDFNAAFGCHACHEAIDQHRLSREDELFYSSRAHKRTLAYWVAKGLIIVAGIVPEKPKTRPKKPGNWPTGRKIESRNDLKRKEERA